MWNNNVHNNIHNNSMCMKCWYLSPELFLLHRVVTDLKDDIRVFEDVVEVEVGERVRMAGHIVFTQGSEYREPV